MKIITQISVFDYEEIEILGDLERCKLLIDHVPDEKIVNTLIEMRGKGTQFISLCLYFSSFRINF